MAPRRAAAAHEALLAAAACAALCASAWLAVDAAPGVFSGEDGVFFNPSGCGLLHAPGRVPLEEILKLHRFSSRNEPRTEFPWTEEALLGSGDVEDNTVVEVSVEDEAAAPTPSRPWSAYFGGFPEYPEAAVPVYRGSSVGGKAWYRGVAAPPPAPADDTPTRLTISLLDDDQLADLPVDEDVGAPAWQGLDQDAGKPAAEDRKVPEAASTLDLDDIIAAALAAEQATANDLSDEDDDGVTVDAKDVEKDDDVVTVDAKDVEKDDDISIDSKELEKAFGALADLVLRAVGEDADLVTDDSKDVEKDDDVVTDDSKDVEKDDDVVTVDAKDVEKDADVVTQEGLQSLVDDIEKLLARRDADARTDNAVEDEAVVLGV